jgi:hypothetical protein
MKCDKEMEGSKRFEESETFLKNKQTNKQANKQTQKIFVKKKVDFWFGGTRKMPPNSLAMIPAKLNKKNYQPWMTKAMNDSLIDIQCTDCSPRLDNTLPPSSHTAAACKSAISSNKQCFSSCVHFSQQVVCANTQAQTQNTNSPASKTITATTPLFQIQKIAFIPFGGHRQIPQKFCPRFAQPIQIHAQSWITLWY